MKEYDSLEVFPVVLPALRSLVSDPRTDTYVFSNGIEAMVSAPVHNSLSLSPYASTLKGIVGENEVRAIKPEVKT